MNKFVSGGMRAYTSTLAAMEETKDEFYGQLDKIISSTHYKHKLLLLGDFNAVLVVTTKRGRKS